MKLRPFEQCRAAAGTKTPSRAETYTEVLTNHTRPMRVLLVPSVFFVDKRGYRGSQRLQESNIWHGRLGEKCYTYFHRRAGLKVPIRTF